MNPKRLPGESILDWLDRLTPIQRVERYLKIKKATMPGLDQEQIHSMHFGDDSMTVLLTEDVQILVNALRKLQDTKIVVTNILAGI